MKTIPLPENFDGALFFEKYDLAYPDWFTEQGVLHYDEEAFGQELSETDLLDCVVDMERKQRIDRREINAHSNAKNIPSWATWDEEQALEWWGANLSDAQVEAISNLADVREMLKRQNAALRALMRMLIAMRDRLWPELPEG